MARVIVGPGPTQQVKRHESGRANPFKTVQTVLIQCTDCGNTLTVQNKPSLVTKTLQIGCRACKIKAAAERTEELKQAAKAKSLEREAAKQQKIDRRKERFCPDCNCTWQSEYIGKHLKPGSKTGNRCPECKDRHRAVSARVRSYQLSHLELQALMDVSGMRCMNHGCDRVLYETVAEATECGSSKQAVLCVDHDHTTGEVRGLLCPGCNFALGHLGDSLDKVLGLAAYIADKTPHPAT